MIISRALDHISCQAEMDAKGIRLPLPPQAEGNSSFEVEMDMYARFMRHLRHVPNSRPEIKVLSALQFTSDMLDFSDAHVAKVLVEMGLRAPRMAFPADFLRYADQALMRERWEVGGPSESLIALKGHWDSVGDDKFAAFRGEYPRLSEEMAV
jgi:hypothetical protein